MLLQVLRLGSPFVRYYVAVVAARLKPMLSRNWLAQISAHRTRLQHGCSARSVNASQHAFSARFSNCAGLARFSCASVNTV